MGGLTPDDVIQIGASAWYADAVMGLASRRPTVVGESNIIPLN